jgi:hypothetical protein
LNEKLPDEEFSDTTPRAGDSTIEKLRTALGEYMNTGDDGR